MSDEGSERRLMHSVYTDYGLAMSSDKASALLEYYQRFSHNVADEIGQLIRDVEYEEQGGELFYCVDFSEIYGYVNGAHRSFSWFPKTLEDAGRDLAVLDMDKLHNLVMEQVLFQHFAHLYLLKPYARDLSDYFDFVRAREVKESFRNVQPAAATEFQHTKDYALLQDIVRRFKDSGSTLAADDAQTVAEIILRQPILQTAKEGKLEVLSRLAEQRLLQISAITESTIERHEPTFDRWRKELGRFRPNVDSSNYNDAEAVALVYAINSCQPSGLKRKRVCLITRSRWMHSIFSDEVKAGLWEPAGGHILRHPRALIGFLSDVENNNPVRVKEQLSRWQKTFSLVAGYMSARFNPRETLNRILANLNANLNALWRGYSTLIASRQVAERAGGDAATSLVIGLAKSQQFEREVTFLKFSFLFDSLERTHFFITTILSPEIQAAVRDARVQPLIPVLPRSGIQDKAIRLRTSHGTPMPFVMYFGQPRLYNQLAQTKDDPWASLTGLADEKVFFAVGVKVPQYEYEWYIAAAYVLSTLGAWKEATRCVIMAQDVSGRTDVDGRAMVEGAYLFSKCRRHHEPSLRGIEEGFIGLFDIIQAHNVEINGNSVMLLRLFSEILKDLYRMRWHEKTAGDPSAAYLTQRGRLGELVDSFRKRAEKEAANVSSPHPERADLFNNVCYHTVQLLDIDADVGILDTPDEISSLFDRFQEECRQLFGALEYWPDNYLDTYVWVLFVGDKREWNIVRHMDLMREEVLRLANILRTRHFVSDFDQQDFQSHSEAIFTYYASIS